VRVRDRVTVGDHSCSEFKPQTLQFLSKDFLSLLALGLVIAQLDRLPAIAPEEQIPANDREIIGRARRDLTGKQMLINSKEGDAHVDDECNSGVSDDMPPSRPSYRFDGELPSALTHLRDQPRWVAWDYILKNNRWTKPPFDPRTGRPASVSDPKTWTTFDAALEGMERHNLAGVGLVLTGDITGGDLDDCITDAGSFSETAAEIVGYAETYCEFSPSGEGIRFLALGKLAAAIKNDALGVEVYGVGRYMTITGNQLDGTPSEIREAPRSLARLSAIVDAARESTRPKPNGQARPITDDFFANVNAVALGRLDDWVPVLHPTARKYPNGAWRVTSKDFGRNLEEDLSYHPDGIRDHGEEHGLTPIDAVQRYGDASDARAAAMWLCKMLGIDPVSLGWRGNANRTASQSANDEPPREFKKTGTEGAERCIVGKCLMNPAEIGEIAARISVEDFENPFNRSVMKILIGLSAGGRNPSIEAVCVALPDEVEPGLSVRQALNEIVKDAVAPWRDAVETLIDQRVRGTLSGIGSSLMSASAGTRDPLEIGHDVIAGVDAALANLRGPERRSYSAVDAADAALRRLKEGARAWPSTGLADLDKIIGGYPTGQLSIGAGRPGSGKTAFTTSSILAGAKRGQFCMFFSLEMTDEQLGARMLTDMAYDHKQPIEYEDILFGRTEKLKPHQARLDAARERIAALTQGATPLIRIVEQRGLTINEIIAQSRKYASLLHREGKRLSAVYVDHIGLIVPSHRNADRRDREVAESTNSLATLAKDIDAAAVGMCQLNRKVEGRKNKRPDLADLRDSGAVEEDASVVVFLYRESYYLAKQRFNDPDAEEARKRQLEAKKYKLELIVAKNRNGKVDITDAYCDIGANAIRNASFAY
jgi:replicative DNA helicase